MKSIFLYVNIIFMDCSVCSLYTLAICIRLSLSSQDQITAAVMYQFTILKNNVQLSRKNSKFQFIFCFFLYYVFLKLIQIIHKGITTKNGNCNIACVCVCVCVCVWGGGGL